MSMRQRRGPPESPLQEECGDFSEIRQDRSFNIQECSRRGMQLRAEPPICGWLQSHQEESKIQALILSSPFVVCRIFILNSTCCRSWQPPDTPHSRNTGCLMGKITFLLHLQMATRTSLCSDFIFWTQAFSTRHCFMLLFQKRLTFTWQRCGNEAVSTRLVLSVFVGTDHELFTSILFFFFCSCVLQHKSSPFFKKVNFWGAEDAS